MAIRGLFALLTFHDDGVVDEILRFGTERYAMVEACNVGIEFLGHRMKIHPKLTVILTACVVAYSGERDR